jgi:hypothetical protein
MLYKKRFTILKTVLHLYPRWRAAKLCPPNVTELVRSLLRIIRVYTVTSTTYDIYFYKLHHALC